MSLVRTVGCVLLLGAEAACRRSDVEDHTPLPPPAVNAQEITAKGAAPIVRRGVATYRTRIELSFSIPGLVDRVLVDRGASVQKGQLLAVLRLGDAAAHLRGAQAQADRARQESEVAGDLVKRGTIPTRQGEAAETNLRLAEARAAEAEDMVDRTYLYAPSAGVISARLVDRGEFVAPSRPVFSLEDPKLVVVHVGLRSDEVNSVARDADVDVVLEGETGTLKGRVANISPAPRPSDGLYDVEATLPSGTPGQTATLSIPSLGPASLRVPVSALVYRRDKAHVFVVADSGSKATAHLRPVAIARIDSGEATLKDGVRAGERVVFEGGYFLIDGQPVSVN